MGEIEFALEISALEGCSKVGASGGRGYPCGIPGSRAKLRCNIWSHDGGRQADASRPEFLLQDEVVEQYLQLTDHGFFKTRQLGFGTPDFAKRIVNPFDRQYIPVADERIHSEMHPRAEIGCGIADFPKTAKLGDLTVDVGGQLELQAAAWVRGGVEVDYTMPGGIGVEGTGGLRLAV